MNSQQVFYRRAEKYHLPDSLFASPGFNALGQQTVVLPKQEQRLFIYYAPKSRQLHTLNRSTAKPRSYKIKAYPRRRLGKFNRISQMNNKNFDLEDQFQP